VQLFYVKVHVFDPIKVKRNAKVPAEGNPSFSRCFSRSLLSFNFSVFFDNFHSWF
jgi:hypothetical protein